MKAHLLTADGTHWVCQQDEVEDLQHIFKSPDGAPRRLILAHPYAPTWPESAGLDEYLWVVVDHIIACWWEDQD